MSNYCVCVCVCVRARPCWSVSASVLIPSSLRLLPSLLSLASVLLKHRGLCLGEGGQKKEDSVASYLWPVHGCDERWIQRPSALKARAQSSRSYENTPLGPVVKSSLSDARGVRHSVLLSARRRTSCCSPSSFIYFLFFSLKKEHNEPPVPARLCCSGTNLSFPPLALLLSAVGNSLQEH